MLFADMVVRYFDDHRPRRGPGLARRRRPPTARRASTSRCRATGGRSPTILERRRAGLLRRRQSDRAPDVHGAPGREPAPGRGLDGGGDRRAQQLGGGRRDVAERHGGRRAGDRAGCATSPGFGAGAGGTLTSGGQEATHTAMLAARAALDPDIWERGISGAAAGDRLRRARALCDRARRRRAGLRHVERARGAVGELEDGCRRARRARSTRCTAEGRRVAAVVATAGSTATGSFDDLEAIGALCERAGSGCTSTARTAPRRCSRPRTRRVSRASPAPARSPGIRTR